MRSRQAVAAAARSPTCHSRATHGQQVMDVLLPF